MGKTAPFYKKAQFFIIKYKIGIDLQNRKYPFAIIKPSKENTNTSARMDL